MRELWFLSLAGAAMVAHVWQEEFGSSRVVVTWDSAKKSYRKGFFFFFKFFPLSPYSSAHICGLTDVISWTWITFYKMTQSFFTESLFMIISGSIE